ncbi:MAG: hypothetical protein JWR14_4706 [Caballeronia sp.]|jgi:hypothetical protein|uniref:hypothetical protein n=1 Tax=Caballeronia sp. TaxID=1931223 RepID=UPI00261A3CE3|nr:hypothetical protein [Caballeronia sp.]MDB5834876.1 hypothetical protein [Caballeronia sp.]
MPTFQLSTKSPSVPQERVRIFRLAPTRVSQKTVFEVARRFGLKGDMKTGSLCQDSRQTSYSEGSLELVVHHASHGLRFHDRARWQVDDGTSRVEFDDETAIRLAEGIIKAHSVVPLDECRVLRVTRLNVGVAEPRTGLAEHRVIDVGVVFGRVIDGIPVEGPGGKVMVYIDHKGDLTGIDRIWRDISGVHADDVPLRSTEVVQQEALREWGEKGSGLVTIDDIRFGYFEHAWDVSQRYLQPAYVLSMTITATEGPFSGRAAVRSGYLGAAALRSPERLVPQPPTVPPQTPRQRYRDGASS